MAEHLLGYQGSSKIPLIAGTPFGAISSQAMPPTTGEESMKQVSHESQMMEGIEPVEGHWYYTSIDEMTKLVSLKFVKTTEKVITMHNGRFEIHYYKPRIRIIEEAI